MGVRGWIAVAAALLVAAPASAADLHVIRTMLEANAALAAAADELGLRREPAATATRDRALKHQASQGQLAQAEVRLSELARESALYAAGSLLHADAASARRAAAAMLPSLSRRLSEDGLEALYAVPVGFRCLVARRELTRLADLAGLKVAVGDAIGRRFAELSGAEPLVLASDKLTAALADARVAAVLLPTCAALALTGPAIVHDLRGWPSLAVALAGSSSAAAWSRDRRTAAMEAGWRAAIQAQDEALAAARASGHAIVSPTGALAADLAGTARRLAAEWAPGAGADGVELLSAMALQ